MVTHEPSVVPPGTVDRLRLPVLLFLAGKDSIIDNRGALDLLSAIKPQVHLQLFDDAIHAIQFDQMDPMVQRIATSRNWTADAKSPTSRGHEFDWSRIGAWSE